MDTEKIKKRIMKARKLERDSDNRLLAKGRKKRDMEIFREANKLWKKITTDRKAQCYTRSYIIYASIDGIEFIFDITSRLTDHFRLVYVDGVPIDKYGNDSVNGCGVRQYIHTTSHLGDVLLFVDRQREIDKGKEKHDRVFT